MTRSLLHAMAAAALALGALTACDDEPAASAPTGPAAAAGVVATPSMNRVATPKAREELLRIEAALDAAWNAGDATAYAAPFAEDVQLITPPGGVVQSREGVRQLHVFLLANPFAGSIRTTTSLEITMLTGTLAIVDRVGDLTNYRFLPPNVVPTLPGVLRARERHVFEKRSGTWQIIFSQITPVAPGV